MIDCDRNQWHRPEECLCIVDSLSQSEYQVIDFEQEWRSIPLNNCLSVWREDEFFVDVESRIQKKEQESILEVLMNSWVEEIEDSAIPSHKEWKDKRIDLIVWNERVVHRSHSIPTPIHIVHRLDNEMELCYEWVDIEEREEEHKETQILRIIE